MKEMLHYSTCDDVFYVLLHLLSSKLSDSGWLSFTLNSGIIYWYHRDHKNSIYYLYYPATI